jgi:hypothetical protein
MSFSCVSQKKEIIAKSTIKLEGKNTNIRNLINIDGFYYFDPSNKRLGGIMFYDDGSWVYFHFKDSLSENKIKKNLTKSIINSGNRKQWGYSWGVYAIQNDTIIVYSYNRPAFLVSYDLSERRYKVINRESIKKVYVKGLLKSEDDYYKTHSPWIDSPQTDFIPADSLPSSDNWLKENKWIWRNESDWEDYMQHVEEVKKQLKKR